VEPAETGRTGYHPSVLLKLYVNGYLNRVQALLVRRGGDCSGQARDVNGAEVPRRSAGSSSRLTAGTPEVGPVDNSAKGLPALNQRGGDGRPLRRSRCRCQQIPLDHGITPSTSPSAFSVEVEQRVAVSQHWVQNSLHFCGVEA